MCRIDRVTIAPDVVFVGETVTFTAEGECLDKAVWSGDGVPAGSKGATLTISWNQAGEKTVTISCDGDSDSKSLTVYDIDIEWNGAVVTGQTVTRVVGQIITLMAKWKPSKPAVVAYEWAVPTKCIKDYKQSFNASVTPGKYDTAGVVETLGPMDLDKDTLQMYAYGVLNAATVRLTVYVGPNQKEVEIGTSLTVTKPAGTLIGTASERVPVIYVEQEANSSLIHCGIGDPVEHRGIRFTGTLQPFPVIGELALLQTISTSRRFTIQEPNLPPRISFNPTTNGQFVLDREPEDGKLAIPQYGSQIMSTSAAVATVIEDKDSPVISLGVKFIDATIRESFRMHLMYRPTGGIWVTLRRLEWNWSADASNVLPNDWTLNASTAPTAGTAADSEVLPEWIKRVQDM